MTVIDLSYATQKPPPVEAIRSMALSVKGWVIGWACFEGAEPKACGHLTVKSHLNGEPVPCYHRAMGAMNAVAQYGIQHKVSLVISHTEGTKSPLWNLPCLVAVTLGAKYGDLPTWRDHVGGDFKDLKSWAAVISGKVPENDLEVYALGLGAAAAQLRQGPSLIQN